MQYLDPLERTKNDSYLWNCLLQDGMKAKNYYYYYFIF